MAGLDGMVHSAGCIPSRREGDLAPSTVAPIAPEWWSCQPDEGTMLPKSVKKLVAAAGRSCGRGSLSAPGGARARGVRGLLAAEAQALGRALPTGTQSATLLANAGSVTAPSLRDGVRRRRRTRRILHPAARLA
jgi:hypothetical protein